MFSIDEPIDGESSSDYSGNLRSSSLDPEEIIIRNQRVQLMRDMLYCLNGKIPPDDRTALFRELSYEEIATELDIPSAP